MSCFWPGYRLHLHIVYICTDYIYREYMVLLSSQYIIIMYHDIIIKMSLFKSFSFGSVGDFHFPMRTFSYSCELQGELVTFKVIQRFVARDLRLPYFFDFAQIYDLLFDPQFDFGLTWNLELAESEVANCAKRSLRNLNAITCNL